MGEQILSGDADLTELNNKSLTFRGKTKSSKLSRDEVKVLATKAPKRKAGEEDDFPPKKIHSPRQRKVIVRRPFSPR